MQNHYVDRRVKTTTKRWQWRQKSSLFHWLVTSVWCILTLCMLLWCFCGSWRQGCWQQCLQQHAIYQQWLLIKVSWQDSATQAPWDWALVISLASAPQQCNGFSKASPQCKCFLPCHGLLHCQVLRCHPVKKTFCDAIHYCFWKAYCNILFIVDCAWQCWGLFVCSAEANDGMCVPEMTVDHELWRLTSQHIPATFVTMNLQPLEEFLSQNLMCLGSTFWIKKMHANPTVVLIPWASY